MDFKLKVAEIFTKLEEDLTIDDALQMIEIPPNSEMGDYAVPCFRFANKYKKAPPMIAADII
ncbi:MAG TPA: arginine--tRNA ligase, partial [Clostridiales bacterium]|nr:arginine--tRNA ligase [Clostridiales bacterium]